MWNKISILIFTMLQLKFDEIQKSKKAKHFFLKFKVTSFCWNIDSEQYDHAVIISDYHFVEILICPLLLECTKLIFNSSKCTKMFWCQLHEVGRMTTD